MPCVEDAGLESLYFSLCCMVIQGWKVYITQCLMCALMGSLHNSVPCV